MSLQGISSRHGVPQAAAKSTVETPTTDTAPAQTADNSQGSTAAEDATTPHLSRAGRFLGFLQRLEDRHPEEAKKLLSGIADKLRHDAERAGPFSDRLNSLADRFDKAAESGELSSLLPSRQHFGHHALRAYHQASGATGTEAADLNVAASGAAATSPAPEASGGAASATGNKPDGGASAESSMKPVELTV